MKYIGPLYGKLSRKYIPLIMTSEEVDELEAKSKHLEEAYISADRLRTEYQLQVEALHALVQDLDTGRGIHHPKRVFDELVTLVADQRKTNHP